MLGRKMRMLLMGSFMASAAFSQDASITLFGAGGMEMP